MGYLPPDSDVPVAQLTKAGRSLLARSIVPRSQLTGSEPDRSLVTFRLSGFAFGDGGYSLSLPLDVNPINDTTEQAKATVAVLDNRFDVNDSLVINGVPFPAGIEIIASGAANGGTEAGGPNGGGTLTISSGSLGINSFVGSRLRLTGGTLAGLDEVIISNDSNSFEIGIPPNTGKTWTQAGGGGATPDITTQWQVITNSPGGVTWVPGENEEETAQNIADAINASTNPLVQNVVRATVENAIITVSAVASGDLGNLNTLVEFDEGGLAVNNFGIIPGTGFLDGGANPNLENPVFPPAAPGTIEDFLDIEFPNPQATSLVCRAGQSEGNFGLGEVGIYVDIIDSVNPQEIGKRILYAIGHFPIVSKNSKSVFVTRVITQY